METRDCLLYVLNYCLRKQFFVSNSSESPPNLNVWIISLTMRLSTQFQFKIKSNSVEKKATFVLLDNYFTDIFSEVQIRYRKSLKFRPEHFLEH